MRSIMKRIGRVLFRWEEQLNILPGERLVVTLLLIALFMGTAIWIWLPPYQTIYDQEDYAELHQLFVERSTQKEREYAQVAQRYTPQANSDPVAAGTTFESSLVEHPSQNDSQYQTKQNKQSKDSESQGSSQDQSPRIISINLANQEALTALPGIGPVIASRIVAYRQNNGYFTSLDQLTNVKGIGPARLQKMTPLIDLKTNK